MAKHLSTTVTIPDAVKGTLVNQYLKQLALETHNQEWQGSQSTDEELLFNLALQVLLEGDFQQRWEVAKLWPKLGTQDITPLLEILKDEAADLEVRWFVGRILGELDDPKVILALTNLLQTTQEEELSAMASATLGKLGPSSIEALSELLTDSSLRLPVVRSLAQIHHSQTILPLLRVIDDPSPEVRATAIEALGSFHDEHLITFLVKALKDPSARVRKEAVIAVGMQGEFQDHYDLVTHLKPLLHDMDDEVCQQAILALGRIGGDQATEALYFLLKSPATPIPLKRIVVRVLSWIATAQSLTYLQEGLRWGDPEVCQEIVVALGGQETPPLKAQASQILMDFLNSGQEASKKAQIKQAVALALGELQDLGAVNLLRGLVSDGDRGVRLHAIAALKRFPLERIS